MNIKCAFILFLILFFVFSALTAESYWNLSLERHDEKSSSPATKYRTNSSDDYMDDLGMGYFRAIVPGFLVHGAGNMYGGRMGTGMALFSLELISVQGIVVTELRGWDGNSTEETDRDFLIKLGSYLLFFGTWTYDIATVHSAVKSKYEKKKFRLSFLEPVKLKYNRQYAIMLMNLTIDL